ncbi:lysophospholipid acyltransferase family protein, partial [Enterococcus faecium]|uniref:lysophospholipid acyltransferase family protein n=1 Tax=Enterococcus faecium TaxID=1352 RepID=UPI0034E9659C
KLDTIKNAKGQLIIANHPSLIDVVVLISIVRNADCVVKADLWKNPFLKGVVKATGYINNDADPEYFLNQCQQSFARGNNLIVFPEGTRSVPGKP